MAALAPLGAKLSTRPRTTRRRSCPESAESTEVVEILDEEFDAGETTQGLSDLLPRGRPDRGRRGEDRLGRGRAPGAGRRGRRRAAADRFARSVLRGRGDRGARFARRRPCLHRPHRPDRLREGRGLGRERPRHDGRRRRRARGPALGRPRLLDRRRGGVRRFRPEAPDRDRAAGPRPPGADLPRRPGRADPARRRLLRVLGFAPRSSTSTPSRARRSPRTAPRS